jgi:hypothetical protein
MKVVQFESGKYAIRRWFFGWQYKDLVNDEFWWRSSDRPMRNCTTNYLETAKQALGHWRVKKVLSKKELNV